MIRKPKIHLVVMALLSLILLLTSCGGGGGKDKGNEGGLRTNTCSTLGLQPRIINGTRCSTENSPVVPIELRLQGGDVALCSGTMITSTHVLTAAHCFPREVRSATIIAEGKRISGARFFRHPGYRETSQALFKDVAVLELESPVNLPVVPIMLSQPVAVGDEIQIFGFGTTERGAIGQLYSGEMRVSSVTPDHIVSSFTGKGSNTCTGDSGGPALLTVNGMVGVVGLTSSGSKDDCLAGDISLFANLQSADYIGFVRSVVPSVGVN